MKSFKTILPHHSEEDKQAAADTILAFLLDHQDEPESELFESDEDGMKRVVENEQRTSTIFHPLPMTLQMVANETKERWNNNVNVVGAVNHVIDGLRKAGFLPTGV